ncbi:MAG: pyruvate/2-oxoglutarate/acetoin dehydrogenase E1 component [Candidatus Azotimanducaceae bacterium]|jgi:pyruvate/2-oxoglutarate/acetoin dehydrogenase E1 component
MTATKRDNKNASQIIAEALNLEMQRDENVVILGEDVGRMGGVFGATRQLQKKYGDRRVRDMPISEMSFAGMGVGMAMAGLRPVIEIMFVDFIGVCLEQIYNAMAKNHYMSGGTARVPMVIKTAGGNIGDAAQHSQCLWGTFAHLPGMYVVAPSSMHDYKGMLAAAIETDNPVVFIEHKRLLMTKGADRMFDPPIPDGRFVVPLGKAQVVRQGRDLTLVTLSATVDDALVAAEELAAEKIDVEVIDLRSVVPLDIETITESVAKTNRLLVVDEDYLSFGLSGEIVAQVCEALSPSEVHQVARHAVPDVPIPAALSLEKVVVPSAESIRQKIQEMSRHG